MGSKRDSFCCQQKSPTSPALQGIQGEAVYCTHKKFSALNKKTWAHGRMHALEGLERSSTCVSAHSPALYTLDSCTHARTHARGMVGCFCECRLTQFWRYCPSQLNTLFRQQLPLRWLAFVVVCAAAPANAPATFLQLLSIDFFLFLLLLQVTVSLLCYSISFAFRGAAI